jgi:cytochrome c-type biogenesis protein CcsB
MKSLKITLVALAALFLLNTSAMSQDHSTGNSAPVPQASEHSGENSHGETPAPIPGLFLNDLRLLPIQTGGRIKPFDEFARESILAFTGNRNFNGYDPSELLVSMMVNPQAWAQVELIRISNEDVRKELLLETNRIYFTPVELMKNNTFLQYAEGISSGGQQVTAGGVNAVTGTHDPRGEEMKRVVDRMSRFQAMISGKLWMVTPPKDNNPDTPWIPLSEGMTAATPQSNAVYAMLKSYLMQDKDGFKQHAAEARKSIEDAMPNFEAAKPKLTAEVFYNRLRPFLQAMILYLLAGFMWFFAGKGTFFRLMAKSLTAMAMFVHILGFGLRCYVAGRPPVTNMYESIIWVSLGVMVFSLFLYWRTKQTVLLAVSTILAGIALFAGDSVPLVMDPTIRPLVPVLRSNYWLTIHVLTITASYGAFMLAMGISNVTLYFFHKKANAESSAQVPLSQRISTLNQLAYRAVMIGTVLLAAGTILGGVWADYSWGRFWGWDPKEVWALIALLAYIAILHARFAGWVGVFAFPLWIVICFATVVMAWYGVNFVLGVGLHSYGFSTGGQTFVAGYLAVQLIYCLWIAYEHKRGTPNANATPKAT